MEKIQWSGYEWLTQERWGDYHPDKPIVWYDPSQVLVEKEVLKLGVAYNPLVMEDLTIPFGVGLVSCTEKFTYGTFEIEARLPAGQPNAWPAFWMWSWESWPPEIDVIEAYSDSRGSYFNWSAGALLGKFWRCETNVHLGVQPRNYSLGAEKHAFSFRDPSKAWIRYRLEWSANRLGFYYNGKLVREVLDEESLSQLRGKTMNVVINNSIQKVYPQTTKSYTFEVRSFTYKPELLSFHS